MTAIGALLASAPGALAADPPPLGGTFFSTQNPGGAATVTGHCAPNGTSTVTFRASGTIDQERWTESATLTIGPQTQPAAGSFFGRNYGPVLTYQSTYTIEGGGRSVSGTKTLPAPTPPQSEFEGGICQPGLARPFVFARLDTLRYAGQTQTAEGSFPDQGAASNTEVSDTRPQFPGLYFQSYFDFVPQCQDRRDNDGDGQRDFPADRHCASAEDDSEQDIEPPVIDIRSPADGGAYDRNEEVVADYSCSDDDPGVQSCVGSVPDGAPIDTSGPGGRTFTVEASDGAGNTSRKTSHYAVRGAAPGTLAFAGVVDDNAEHADLYTIRSDGTGQSKLNLPEAFAGQVGAPDWSRDGSRVAFRRDNGSRTPEIWMANADGSDPMNVISDSDTSREAMDYEPSWSPDGAKIAFSSDNFTGGFHSDIFVTDLEGNRTDLTPGQELYGPNDYQPAWSPDGSKIAFVSDRGRGNPDIWVMDADGSDPTRLTEGADADDHPSWSPDGSRIVWRDRHDDHGPPGGGQIWVMDADGANKRFVTEDGSEPAWGPDGQTIALVRPTRTFFGEGELSFEQEPSPIVTEPGSEADVYTVRLDGSEPTRVTTREPADLAPAWRPERTAPAVSISDVEVREGSTANSPGEGTTPATFRVTLSRASGQAATVRYATRSGTATALVDFERATGEIAFAPGETEKSVSVRVVGDREEEPDERFSVVLSDPVGAVIADGEGVATILDDDGELDTEITGGPSGPTSDATPTFTFTASEPGATFACRLGSGDFAACSSPHTVGPLADGDHTFEVRAVDSSGRADSTPAARSFRVDTVAPATTIVSGPPRRTNNRHPTFDTRASEPDATIECRITSAAETPAFAPCPEHYTSHELGDGDYIFEARAVDAAGNADPTPPAYPFTVDTTPPDTRLEGPGRARPGDGRAEAPPAPASAGSVSAGGQVSVTGGTHATLRVTCPPDAPTPCEGTATLSTSQATVAHTDFEVPPGASEPVTMLLPPATRNRVERDGRLAVTATVETRADGSADPAVTHAPVTLTPDPRTPLVRDAGLEVPVVGDGADVRLTCPRARAEGCRGRITLERMPAFGIARARPPRPRRAVLGRASFRLRRGRTGRPRVALSRAARRLARRAGGAPVVVVVATRQRAGGTVRKRLDLTLTTTEARR